MQVDIESKALSIDGIYQSSEQTQKEWGMSPGSNGNFYHQSVAHFVKQ